ncbi:MAG: phosphoenolpyruvate--protein phosphotransferase [Treponemataceae bacterium]|nr:phosphoenolpyruvate--protein phosphotransferase [Treponemataceae bacterium]
MKIYHGKSVSQGIAVGNAFIVNHNEKPIIPKIKITKEEKVHSWARFETALSDVTEYYKTLKEGSNKEQSDIIDTYLMMLSDATFITQIKEEFDNSKYNLEFCVKQCTDDMASHMRSYGDSYFADRANDIEDVFGRVILSLLGKTSENLDDISENSIVFAENLSTSEAMTLFKNHVQGIVLKEGGVSSHISIIARTYGIPALVGVENPCEIVDNGNPIVLDAIKSIIVINPDKMTLFDYSKKVEELKNKQIELDKYRTKKGQTKDGTTIRIYANISSLEEAEIAKQEGADGIGLFRTEFLFMNNEESVKMATENEQFKVYSEVLKLMEEKPVTIRTLDCGGDKITSFNEILTSEEKNPLLGCRAIRFCLKRPDIFKTQLRALYRASVNGNLKILLPMVTNFSQVTQTRNLIKEIQAELDAENLPYNKDVKLGIMIETPCAAIMADDLSRTCDFFSIGSNDLTQYLIAVDRENTTVSDLYSELNPSVLRTIAWVSWVAKTTKTPISVCGEMASRTEMIKYLLTFGIRDLSVSPRSISSIKEMLANCTISELSELESNCLINKTIVKPAYEMLKKIDKTGK